MPTSPRITQPAVRAVHQTKAKYDYMPGRLYVDGVSSMDPLQGRGLGCPHTAAFVLIAHKNPKIIEEALGPEHAIGRPRRRPASPARITPAPKYQAELRVRLFAKELETGALTPVEEPIDSKLPVLRSPMRDPFIYMHGRDREELWPALLEKALAKRKEGYEKLVGGVPASDAAWAAEALAGKPSTLTLATSFADVDELWRWFEQNERTGIGVLTCSMETLPPEYAPMRNNHVYAVLEVEVREGVRGLEIADPEGFGEPILPGDDAPNGRFFLPIEEVPRLFSELHAIDLSKALPR